MSTSHLTSIHVNREDLHTFNILSLKKKKFLLFFLLLMSRFYFSTEDFLFFVFSCTSFDWISNTRISLLLLQKMLKHPVVEPATKSYKDPCRVAVKTSHTHLQDQREGKGWKEKVKHEEEKGTETKLGYGGKELGKEKRFKRKRQAGNPSLCGSRLKSMKIKVKHGQR